MCHPRFEAAGTPTGLLCFAHHKAACKLGPGFGPMPKNMAGLAMADDL
jgi:hypothetical protein